MRPIGSARKMAGPLTIIGFLILAGGERQAASAGVTSPAAPLGVIYVDADAAASGTGSGWSSPLRFLQDAVQIAADPSQGVTEIRVAQGVYLPDRSSPAPSGSGDRSATFHLLPGVALLGGFAGMGAPDPDARDITAYPSVLSGDLLGDDQPGGVNHADNAHHVVRCAEGDSATLLEGFTIRGGNCEDNSVPNRTGAGLLAVAGSPRVTRCTFIANFALMGAAVFCQSGNPVFDTCQFIANQAVYGRGGAVYVAAGSVPSIVNCSFTDNSAFGGSGVGDGGAIFIENDSPVTVAGCVFRHNIATTVGPVTSTGGAISNLANNMTVRNCIFGANQAFEGGAMWNGGDNVRVINSTFAGNKATSGGALLVFPSSIQLLGCTLVANSAADGGGVSNGLFSLLGVHDCVLSGNIGDQSGELFLNQIHNNGGAVTLTYSCVQGVFTPVAGQDPPNPADFPGCLDTDPLLVNIAGLDKIPGTADDNLRLAWDSPCIDAGDNGMIPLDSTLDLDGHPREMNDPGRPDSGIGPPPVVDMGAYEFRPGDLDRGGLVNNSDLQALLGAWGGCANCPADLNADGRVDYADLGILLGNWR